MGFFLKLLKGLAYSATTGMIKVNLDAFFKAKTEGHDFSGAVNYMIDIRYALFPSKKKDFIALYTLYLIEFKNPENNSENFPPVFSVLSIILNSFYRHHDILPEDLGENVKEELRILSEIISLMHIYEGNTLYSPPPIEFLDDFICDGHKEYFKRIFK